MLRKFRNVDRVSGLQHLKHALHPFDLGKRGQVGRHVRSFLVDSGLFDQVVASLRPTGPRVNSFVSTFVSPDPKGKRSRSTLDLAMS
jgi:hypothetical protein